MPHCAFHTIRSYHGANSVSPRPGISLMLHCTADDIHDYTHHLATRFKECASQVGLLIAYVDVACVATVATTTGNTTVIRIQCDTPLPEIAVALIQYILDENTQHEDAYEALQERLFAMQQQVIHNTPSDAVLHLMAEARHRDVPVMPRYGMPTQVGYGAHGWRIPPIVAACDTVPWHQIGTIPIYVVTGEQLQSKYVALIAAMLDDAGMAPHVLTYADEHAILAALANPTVKCLLIGMNTASLVQHGIPFDRCTLSVVTDVMADDMVCPYDVESVQQWVEALGVPMLVSRHATLLNMDDPMVAWLAQFAPCQVAPLSQLKTVMQACIATQTHLST